MTIAIKKISDSLRAWCAVEQATAGAVPLGLEVTKKLWKIQRVVFLKACVAQQGTRWPQQKQSSPGEWPHGSVIGKVEGLF